MKCAKTRTLKSKLWLYREFCGTDYKPPPCVFSCLLQVWLFYCWMSCSRRAMVLALVSLSSLLPTSVRQSSGRPSVPPLSTLAEVRILQINKSNWICFYNDNCMTGCYFFHRYWVWGSDHCSLSSPGHPYRQSACPKRGLLQTKPP